MRLAHAFLVFVGVIVAVGGHSVGGPGSGPGSLAGPNRLVLVPRDHTTIQGAIAAAPNGATILVSPGTYVENIDFKGKRVRVKSAAGPDVTTIDGNGNGTTVSFVSGEGRDSVIDGFTITGGTGTLDPWSGHSGGGIYCLNSSPTIVTNVITDNDLTIRPMHRRGGGIAAWKASSPLVMHNVITRNTLGSSSGDAGGGMYIRGLDSESNPTIIANIISDNSANWGGGVHFNGGSGGHGVLISNMIVENTATGRGGGVLVNQASAPHIVNNTIAGNIAPSGAGFAFVVSAAMSIRNTIVYHNVGPAIYTYNSTPGFEYCDVSGGWVGTGNFDQDPLFVNVIESDYHLSSSSPGIDAGLTAAATGVHIDFEGDVRVINSLVDVGADEFAPAPVALAISPDRSKYDVLTSVTISGQHFSMGVVTDVRFGGVVATNVVVVDANTITCDIPAGPPGHVDVEVESILGVGTMERGFAYTPAIAVSGDFRPGGGVDLQVLCDPGDSIWTIYGGLPQQNLQTPPFDGTLRILPFQSMFLIPNWPLDEFNTTLGIPNDGALSGVTVLMQGLVGPSLSGQKDAAWTNCQSVVIQ